MNLRCWLLSVVIGCSFSYSQESVPVVPAAATAAPSTSLPSLSGLYLKVHLQEKLKLSSLNPGDVIEGRLAGPVYSRDRELFSTGSPIRLTVDKLERRKRQPNDHWPWVIKVFTPRHENYPIFHSAVVTLADGTVAPLEVNLISSGPQVTVHPKPNKKVTGPSQAQGETQEEAEAGKKNSVPTLILEASPLTVEEMDKVAPAEGAGASASLGPLTLDAGALAKVVLLGGVSASGSIAGDPVRARLVEPVRSGSNVLLPAGTILEGAVIRATPPRWLSRSGSLLLKFSRLSVPGGREAAVTASVTALQVNERSHAKIDPEGQIRGDRPGKLRMVANLGVTLGIAKVTDDALQLIIEAAAASATDASTAGTARLVALGVSTVFLVTRHGRDVALPRFTEMTVIFDRPATLPDR